MNSFGASSIYFRYKHYLVFLTTLLAMTAVHANPTGGVVTAGSATISQAPNSTVIQQTSQQAILQWNTFNINKGETTKFVQPNSSSVALNRINANQGASTIYGSLQANGQVILINAAGIHFGAGSMVNVAGLIASTSDISNANFLAGNYVFDVPSTIRGASVVNNGTIIASNYGLVALLGSNVSNTGTIQAEMGNVLLGTGNKFTLAFNGDQLINFEVDGAAATGGQISNTGSLIADAGKVMITAQAAQAVLDDVIDMNGVAQANSVAQQNGEIILSSNGTVTISGKISAQGAAVGNTGGSIQVTSDAIQLNNASVNANGNAGGGTISFSAADAANNSFVNLSYNTAVQANALASGTGGTVNVSTANFNLLNSSVSANGSGAGAIGGNIDIAANAVNLWNSHLNATGDLVGGNVDISGVPSSGNMTNSAYINMDSWSSINVNASGADSVIAGSVSLNTNNLYLYGNVTADDNNAGAIGGEISLMGQNLFILPGADVEANAPFLGGTLTIGGNPLSTTSSAASADVYTFFGSYVGAAATGSNGFGGSITISANVVSLGGELDVSGNPYPYITYSGGSSSSFNNMCGGGGYNRGTPTINNSGASGGQINVTGNNITVQTGAYLTAAGNVFGGEISLGNSQYSSALSASLTVNAGSLIDAGSYGTANNPIGGQIQMVANNTYVNGVINASAAANSGSLGGEIEIFAQNNVTIGSFATVLANGAANGGEILVGGDVNGAGTDINAQSTTINFGSLLSASALTNGPGGEVSVWSQQSTYFAGAIIARGGQAGGDGGQVEVSSAGNLTVANTAYVDVSAPHGMAGTYTQGSPTTITQVELFPLFPWLH
jgi:filamentous hemagglutinin family protein